MEDKSFKKVVQDVGATTMYLAGGYVLKEKFKKLKQRLKDWNKNQFGDAQQELKKVEAELNNLEKEGDGRQLNEEDQKLSRQLKEDLWWWATRSVESIARQNARTKWIKEGDRNSRYFHLTVNWKRHYNMLRGVNVDGCWIHELGRVKKEIRLFFKMRFQESEWERLRLDSGPLIRNIMNCWWLISKRMKLRQQYGIVVVPKALDQMD